MNEITKYIDKLYNRNNLDIEETERVMQIIFYGGATPAQISAFIMGLAVKGESVSEAIGVIKAIQTRIKKYVYFEFLNYDFSIDDISNRNSITLDIATSIITASQNIKTVKYIEITDISENFLEKLGIKIRLKSGEINNKIEIDDLTLILFKKNYLFPIDLISVIDEIKIFNIFDIVKNIAYLPINSASNRIIKTSSSKIFKLYKDIVKFYKVNNLSIICNKEQYISSNYEKSNIDFQFAVNRFASRDLLDILSGYDNIYREILYENTAMNFIFCRRADNMTDALNLINISKAKSILNQLVEVSNNINY